MLSLLIYTFCFSLLFFISEDRYKTPCIGIISLLSLQVVFSYYVNLGLIYDVLFYIVVLSFIDLLMVFCIIINNFIIKDYNILMSLVAIFSVFATLLSVFNYYSYYYLQYASMIIMEYLYFSIKQQQRFNVLYYAISVLLIVPHIIT